MILKIDEKELMEACRWVQSNITEYDVILDNLFLYHKNVVIFVSPSRESVKYLKIYKYKKRNIIKAYREFGGELFKVGHKEDEEFYITDILGC